MALVRCQKHGRIWDNTKEEGCPLCLQEASMPRAPGAAPKTTSPDEASAKGRQFLLLVLVLVVGLAGGYYWYRSNNPRVSAAQAARDSLRALAAAPRVDTTRFALPSDLTPIRRARALSATLSSLLSANRATIMGMAEGPIDTTLTGRAEKRRELQRAAFVKRWHERIDAAAQGGTDFRYAPNTRMGPQMETVTNYLGAALSVMRDMVPRDYVKPRADRQADAAAVSGYLSSAGNVLTNLPR